MTWTIVMFIIAGGIYAISKKQADDKKRGR